MAVDTAFEGANQTIKVGEIEVRLRHGGSGPPLLLSAMRYFFRIMPAVFALLWGSILLLEVLAWASLPDGRREGVAYYSAVLGKLFGARTALGMCLVCLGLGGLLRAVFVVERKRVFWGLLGIGLACLLGLLVAVNYFGLQAGTVWFLSNEFRR